MASILWFAGAAVILLLSWRMVAKMRNQTFITMKGMLHKFFLWDMDGPERREREGELIDNSQFVVNAFTISWLWGAIMGAGIGTAITLAIVNL